MLPKQLFYNTGIPACLWFLSRDKESNGGRKRPGEVLFIDASEKGFMRDRTHREFSEEDLEEMYQLYNNWRTGKNRYEDIKGFCKSSSIHEVRKHNYVLTPGRYVGFAEVENDGLSYEEKISNYSSELSLLVESSKELDEKIKVSLESIGIKI
jgi:type I restriction enzyme M protein